jgi:excisionase family DNA binding protein
MRSDDGSRSRLDDGSESIERRLLDVTEVARLLAVRPSWVYKNLRARVRDRLPGMKVGKYWRFQEGEVRAWIARQRRA